MGRKRKQNKYFALSASDRVILNAFSKHRDPRILTRWYFDWEPHHRQLEWLRAIDGRYGELYMSTGNRFGKSEVAGVVLLLVAMLNPSRDFHVLNASITMDQAEIVWRFCERMATESPNFEHWVDDVVHSPFPTIKLRHGTEIWARSTQNHCKYIEGHKFRCANFDEIADGTPESLEVLKMRVVDCDGFVMGTGTPHGKNWYYRECWKAGQQEQRLARTEKRKPDIFLLAGTSYDNPHVSHDALSKLRYTDRQRQRRIEGLFLDDDDSPFPVDQVDAMINPDLNPQLEATAGAVNNGGGAIQGSWVVGWDLAKAQDYTVGVGLRTDTRPWQLGYFERFRREPWPKVETRMKVVQDRLDADTIFDATGVGSVTQDHLDIPLWRTEPFVFTAKTKGELITNLQYCIEKGKVQVPHIEQLRNELYDYQIKDDGLETDCVMALALACWKANDEKPPMEVVG